MLQEDEALHKVKVVVIGGTNVGKTSMIQTYLKESPGLGQVTTTIHLAYAQKEEIVDNQIVTLHICDTAGQERFQSICPNFYRDADAAIIVFDVTNKASFERMKSWLDEVTIMTGANFIKVIAGNKMDLADDRVITMDEAMEFAREANAEYFETSALTGMGIHEVFHHVCRERMNTGKKLADATLSLVVTETPKETNRNCCF